MSSINCHYTTVKTALRKQPLADFFTISKYGFSPYRACEHGCLYCDGRAEKYYVEGVFDHDIVIRKNIPELLDVELQKIREPGFLCIGSGVSDPYQPVEEREGIMRRCAEILLKYDVSVVVMTKSSLVLRDLDIWAELNRKKRFLLMVSLTFSDDQTRNIFEPNASPIHKRIDVLHKFKDAGCFTGMLAMPLLPFISETEDNMMKIAEVAKTARVDFCMPGGLTLRPGVQKETFLECIKKAFPHLLCEYEKIYAENRQSGGASMQWRKSINPLYQKMTKAAGVSIEIPHYVFKGFVPLYEEVFLVLSQMKIAYQNKCIDTRRLQKATKLYVDWVIGEKKGISRSRKRSFNELDQKIIELCENNLIQNIVENEKLGEFIKKLVVKNAVFDSGMCQLMV